MRERGLPGTTETRFASGLRRASLGAEKARTQDLNFIIKKGSEQMPVQYKDYENVFVMDHPLIQHKITQIRDKNTGTNQFRSCTEEIASLMGYEALRDLPLEDMEVETPIEKCMSPVIAGKKLAVVPILRAGLGMVSGIMNMGRGVSA